jgi:hypothetical protein
VINSQSPPPAPQVQTQTEYIQVPVDSPELQGLRLGMNFLVQQNPGVQSTIETLKEYAKQFTSGLGGKQTAV